MTFPQQLISRTAVPLTSVSNNIFNAEIKQDRHISHPSQTRIQSVNARNDCTHRCLLNGIAEPI